MQKLRNNLPGLAKLLIIAGLLFLPRLAMAASVQQTNSATISNDLTTAINSAEQTLGTGLTGTATGATYYWKDSNTTTGRTQVNLYECTSAAYTSCSLVKSASTTVSQPNSKTRYDITFAGGGYALNASKYYMLSFQCSASCGGQDHFTYGSSTDTYLNGQAYICIGSVGCAPPGTAIGISDLYFILEGSSTPPLNAVTLNVNTFSPYLVGQQISFTVGWAGVTFTPTYINFFEDLNDNNYFQTLNITTGTGAGSRIFTHAFSYASPVGQPYNPAVDITNCPGTNYKTGTGCFYASGFLTAPGTLVVVQPGSQSTNSLYPAVLTINQTTFVEGDDAYFTYALGNAHGICAGSSVSGRRLFLGYPSNLGQADSGSILSVDTGSLLRTYTTASSKIGAGYYPYIRLFCADGSSHDLYVGSTWTLVGAVLVEVYTNSEYSRLAIFSRAFTNCPTGTGGYVLSADKLAYSLYEPVSLHWAFPNFAGTITKIRLYKDQNKLPADFFDFSSATDISKTTNHYTQYTYSAADEYFPSITILSGATVERNFYLGGNIQPSLDCPIHVIDQPFIPAGGGISNFFGSGGIFALGTIFQIPVDPSQSTAIQALIVIANGVIQQTVSLAGYGYKIFLQSAFFQWVADTVAPPASSRTVPANIIGFDITTFMPSRDFTITYANLNPMIIVLLDGAFAVAFLLYISNKILH